MRIKRLPVGLLGTNCYLIELEKTLVLVDPGGSAEQITRQVNRIGKPVVSILLTHGHFDHILAIPALCRTFADIPVFIHPSEAEKVSEKGIREFLSHADPALLSGIREDFAFPSHILPLTDGSVVSDAELLVLHTPGHSPGSTCLYSREEGVLFSGDTLFKGTVGRTDLPGGDMETLLASIEKQLLPLDEETAVYPGHGEDTTILQEKRSNPFLRNL